MKKARRQPRRRRSIHQNRAFALLYVQAIQARPVVNKPCEGSCGRIIERSVVDGRVICSDCEFAERCKTLAASWRKGKRPAALFRIARVPVLSHAA